MPPSLFRYLNEKVLFARPTYAALLALLDNYNRMTGQTEDFSPQQLAEQDTFLKETMSNTELGRELFAFLYTKGECDARGAWKCAITMVWRVVNPSILIYMLPVCFRCLSIRERLPSGPEDDVVRAVLPQQQQDGLQRF